MVEHTTPFRDVKSDTSEAVEKLREEVDRFVEGFGVQEISRKVQDFGKENPVSLAIGAFVLGIAAGALLRRKLNVE